MHVAEGDIIRCDAVNADVDSTITFDKVVLLNRDGKVVVGQPTVAGASVSATVLRQDKDRKILVFKYKPKKRVRKLFGHRQRFAEIRIDKIVAA